MMVAAMRPSSPARLTNIWSNAAWPAARNGARWLHRRRVGRVARWGYEMVRLTDQTLSCAARALVATAERHAACLHVSRAMRAACRPAGTAERGGSAAGPKPGRASFYGELGRIWPKQPLD